MRRNLKLIGNDTSIDNTGPWQARRQAKAPSKTHGFPALIRSTSDDNFNLAVIGSWLLSDRLEFWAALLVQCLKYSLKTRYPEIRSRSSEGALLCLESRFIAGARGILETPGVREQSQLRDRWILSTKINTKCQSFLSLYS